MKLGITINNIIRDHITKLVKVYEYEFDGEVIYPIDPYNLYESFPIKTDISEQPEFNVGSEPHFLENDEDSRDFDVYDFIYNEAPFEIFGRSDITEPNLLIKLKNMSKKLGLDIHLMNKESPKSKCATLNFLSLNNFDFKKLHFPKWNRHFWVGVDVILTDDPDILKCKPTDKVSIKFETDYNKHARCDYKITKLSELKRTIKLIKKNEWRKFRNN